MESALAPVARLPPGPAASARWGPSQRTHAPGHPRGTRATSPGAEPLLPIQAPALSPILAPAFGLDPETSTRERKLNTPRSGRRGAGVGRRIWGPAGAETGERSRGERVRILALSALGFRCRRSGGVSRAAEGQEGGSWRELSAKVFELHGAPAGSGRVFPWRPGPRAGAVRASEVILGTPPCTGEMQRLQIPSWPLGPGKLQKPR